MAKRLTEKQKEEITKCFQDGKTINLLSQEFKCTKLTVIRNLKKKLGELKYKKLLNKSKSLKERTKTNNESNDLLKINSHNQYLDMNSNDSRVLNESITSSNYSPIDSFLEITPLDYEIDNTIRKELSSVPISEVDFPKVVYMVVDQKIDLEIKLLRDFPEWDFLPSDDLNRKTIEIFFDLNLAKRSCNKDQKVLKVPNTNVFKIAAPVLLAKGISRIV